MILLYLGVALWWAAHLWKRAAPAHRARFALRGKAVVAVALAASVLLMIFGYRAVDATAWWAPTPMLKGLNNLLVLAGFYLFAASWRNRRSVGACATRNCWDFRSGRARIFSSTPTPRPSCCSAGSWPGR